MDISTFTCYLFNTATPDDATFAAGTANSDRTSGPTCYNRGHCDICKNTGATTFATAKNEYGSAGQAAEGKQPVKNLGSTGRCKCCECSAESTNSKVPRTIVYETTEAVLNLAAACKAMCGDDAEEAEQCMIDAGCTESNMDSTQMETCTASCEPTFTSPNIKQACMETCRKYNGRRKFSQNTGVSGDAGFSAVDYGTNNQADDVKSMEPDEYTKALIKKSFDDAAARISQDELDAQIASDAIYEATVTPGKATLTQAEPSASGQGKPASLKEEKKMAKEKLEKEASIARAKEQAAADKAGVSKQPQQQQQQSPPAGGKPEAAVVKKSQSKADMSLKEEKKQAAAKLEQEAQAAAAKNGKQ